MFIMEILLVVLALLSGIILMVRGGFLRFTGLAIVIAAFVFLLNLNPFRTTPFDPYHGDQGIAPFQLLIDDVALKGGLTFWGHLETNAKTVRMGLADVREEAHPEVLQASRDYTGFIALGSEPVTITGPALGQCADRILQGDAEGTRVGHCRFRVS